MSLIRYILIPLLWLFSLGLSAQLNPVSWEYELNETTEPDLYEVVFTATIASPWWIYEVGPTPTTFAFAPTLGVERVGELVLETRSRRMEDPILRMEVGYLTGRAVFSQRVKSTADTTVLWPVTVTYQACDDQSCLAPADHEFLIPIPAARSSEADSALSGGLTDSLGADFEAQAGANIAVPPPTPQATSGDEPGDTAALIPPPESRKSLWGLLLEALLWGLAAFLTPCVFPMAPLTVSFFLKSGETKTKGKFRALFYGLFIVLLYVVPLTVVIGAAYLLGGERVTADLFNRVATHWLPNVLFFVVFMLFAASFFGAFEFRLPARWVNGADRRSDRKGLSGIFFMALTLVLVSFSCTGPIVGSVLVASTRGAIWEPILTMSAFAVAFALPFTLLAFFPSLLTKWPRSGGWLNSVKVSLGFIEIALGLKFLSIADQTYHWGLLDREIYLALWIVIFALLGFYLLGKIRFKYDSPVEYLGVFRLLLVVAVFSFVVYLLPGLWGAPLKALSGYLPPMQTQDFILSSGQENSSAGSSEVSTGRVKYGDFLSLPHGLSGFFDYEEGMAFAREAGKPVFIDITGHGCVNCREMEARVWSDPEVLPLLRDEYVIIALYMDDKTRLPESQWVTDSRGRTLKTLGRINADWAIRRFGTSAQPYYVLLNNAGEALTPPMAYTLDTKAFVDFLRAGIAAYR